MKTSRRTFLKYSALALGSARFAPFGVNRLFGQSAESPHPIFAPGEYRRIDSPRRTYHYPSTCQMILEDEEYPRSWKEAGVSDVWFTTRLYGRYAAPMDELNRAAAKALSLGMRPHLFSVPFGHPTPFDQGPGLFPSDWKPAERFTGRKGWGASCHAPADRECVEANRRLGERFGPCDHFLDDDFRLADSPDAVGGCFCAECRAAYQKSAGLSDSRWDELIDDLKRNNDTPLLRAWVDYQCDRLTDIFRRTKNAASNVDLGIMVMCMGSERAGIRWADYRDALVRVGEGMFNDPVYDVTKNKTIELFSALFHRRFTSPGRSFSETTMHPDFVDALSKENMASKLAISTFSDVRNTMFMGYVPAYYWPFLAPRMKKEARFHNILSGKKPAGPFKHFWGTASRYLAGDNAYSLFLALGVPFEVCGELPNDGWTFIGDADAAALERGTLTSTGTRCVARTESAAGRFTKIDETFDSLFTFRRTLLETLNKQKIPYIEEETPVVLGWYPEARAVLLWNIEKEPKTVRLRRGGAATTVELAALDTALLVENDDGSYQTEIPS